MFLSIEKALEKDQWGPTLNALPYCFSPHFREKGVTFLLSYNAKVIIKHIKEYNKE